MNEELVCYLLVFLTIFISIKIYHDSDSFQLTCVLSDVDGEKYCVRERKNLKNASNLLASTTHNMSKLIKYLHDKYPEKENVSLLYKNYNPRTIKEILPTSEYTAYSENKGEKIAFCLGENKTDVDNLIDQNTLMFVALHELSHLASKSIGHTQEFWDNFKFILQESEKQGIYRPIDYKKKQQNYCGMNIKDNPYFDH
jgi:hypothetical protein